MNNTILQVFAGLGGAAFAAYGTYAAVTYMRYGKASAPDGKASPLYEFMPEFEVRDVHRRRVRAPEDTAFSAACNLPSDASPVVRGLFGLRALPARLLGRYEEPEPALPLVRMMESYGWRILSIQPGRHVVLGAMAQPWSASVDFLGVNSGGFRGFNEPGYAKIAFMIEAHPVSATTSVLGVETRVTTTDRKSRAKFRRYWSLVSPGVVAIRYEMLRQAKAVAEQGLTSRRLMRARTMS